MGLETHLMKIVKRGVTEAEKRYRVTCTSCKSLLEYTGKDILSKHYDQRDGDTFALGPCPVCDKTLFDYAPRAL